MKHRPIMKLSPSLERRLAMYARAATAAGVGLLALQQPAAGKIVYTKANQQFPVQLDLNHDGITDYLLNFHGPSTYGFFDISVVGSQGNLMAGYCHRLSSRCWASALQPRVRVGPNQRFAPYSLMVDGRCGIEAKGTSSSCRGYGPWNDAQNRYLGFDFLIKGKVHYGWARVSVSISGRTVSAVLTGYAYETVANRPLITGKTKGPDTTSPEVGTLGHLARGR
jgi:hypothetical protein